MKDIVDQPNLTDHWNAWIDDVLASIPARAATAMTAAITQITAFAELPQGWDTYDADVVSPVAIRSAIDALVEIAQSDLPLPSERLFPFHIAPLADGGVQLEWEGPRKSLEIEFGAHGEICYLLVTRAEEGRKYQQGDDLSVAGIPALVAQVAVSQAT